MGSIYNISTWAQTPTTWKKNAITKDPSVSTRFWYSLQDNNTSLTEPAVGDGLWNGNINVTINGTTTIQPYFFWAPSYNISTAHEPKINSIQFGDGYEQRLKDGINNTPLNFTLSFEGRDEDEAAAILHFLHARQGFGAFYFKAPAPYSIIKKFVCKRFNSSFIFADNYNIQCELQEIS
tara:strand:+ start:877 stop:1413 length:537 start_codon:yes stop_codon:yes gene_type:complete